VVVTYGTHVVGKSLKRRTVPALLQMGAHFGALMVSLQVMRRRPGRRRAHFYGVVDAFTASRDRHHANLKRLCELVRQGAVTLRFECIGLEDVADSHARLEAGTVQGQLVLRFSRGGSW
jgi:D-arabinose 1-dehydrogenase-like Zn-dependent alcohol dehydrogenase